MTTALVMVFMGTLVVALVLQLGRRSGLARLRPAARIGMGLARLARLIQGKVARGAKKDADVQLLITQVAALLRAGAPPGAAWRRAAGVRVDSAGVPDQMALSGLFGGEAAVAMTAATRLAGSLGAPLATVLHATGKVLTAEAEAAAERAAIMAGPQTTARVLLCLPLLGLAIGWLLGADPIGAAFGGGVATVSMLAGLALMLVGRAWIARLIASAAKVAR